MKYLKPTKEKIKLYLFIIIASLTTAILLMLINRFFVTSIYWEYPIYYKLVHFVIGIFRYIIIGYLIIALFKKKLSPTGEYYYIFKIALLLWAFSFLRSVVVVYINQRASEIFFTRMNIEFFVVGLLWYYLLACIIYYLIKTNYNNEI